MLPNLNQYWSEDHLCQIWWKSTKSVGGYTKQKKSKVPANFSRWNWNHQVCWMSHKTIKPKNLICRPHGLKVTSRNISVILSMCLCSSLFAWGVVMAYKTSIPWFRTGCLKTNRRGLPGDTYIKAFRIPVALKAVFYHLLVPTGR